jgi:hypothetical protein
MLFDLDFIDRVAAALRTLAREKVAYAHLETQAIYLERDARVNLNRAGRLALRLNRKFDLGVK